MNSKNNTQNNDRLSAFSRGFLSIIDLFCGKYLYLFVVLNTAVITLPVLDAVSTGSSAFMYFTADSNVIGSRPSSLFGIMSPLVNSYPEVLIIFRIMYILSMLLLAFSVFLFLRKIPTDRSKLLGIMAIDLVIAVMFGYTAHPALSLTLMLSSASALFAFFLLIFSDKKAKTAAPCLSAAAVLIDCRSLILMLLLTAAAYFIGKKSGKKIFTVYVPISLAAALAVCLILSFTAGSPPEEEAAGEYMTAEYVEKCEDDNLRSSFSSDINNELIPEGYLTLTYPQLMVDDCLGIAVCLIDFVFTDTFQKICLIYISIVLVWDRLSLSRSSDDEDDPGQESTMLNAADT